MTVIEQPQEDKLQFSHNNCVVRIATTSTPSHAIVSMGFQSATIYPAPDGTIYYNFKEWVNLAMPNNRFNDTLAPELDNEELSSYTYAADNFLRTGISVQVHYVEVEVPSELYSATLSFTGGVMQITDVRKLNRSLLTAMTKPNVSTLDYFYYQYSKGFPFDLVVGSRAVTELHLKNLNTLHEITLPAVGEATRIVFDDGNLNTTLADILAMQQGVNFIQVNGANILVIEIVEACSDNLYIKWRNGFGHFSYWNFGSINRLNISNADIGSIEVDRHNIENTNGREDNLGSQALRTINVLNDGLDIDKINLLESLNRSPKIYIFDGNRFDRATPNDWVTVKLAPTNQILKNYKQTSGSVAFTFRLPDDYTMLL